MRKNLFDYLEKLDKNEFKKIKKYLDSPYFAIERRGRVIELFEILKNDHPKFENSTDQFLAKKLAVGINTLRNLKSGLTKCIEGHLKQKIIDDNKQLKTQLLAQAYDDANMHQYFIKYANEELDKLQKKENLNKEDYKLKYELLSRKYAIVGHNMVNFSNIALEDAIATLSNFYLYENLKNLNGLIATNKVVDRGAKIPLTQRMINSITIDQIEDICIKASYLVYKYYNLKADEFEEKQNTYLTLKQLVWSGWAKLTNDYKYETYQHMVNMANEVSQLNEKQFSKECFKIHQFWIDKKVHLQHPEIHHFLFLSIAISACDSGKFDWCKKFIAENKQMIPNNEKQATVDLSLAYCYFSTNQLDDAIEKLYHIIALGVYFNLLVRLLMLRCLYVAKYNSRFVDYYNGTFNYIKYHTEINENAKNDRLKFIAVLNQIRIARAKENIKKLKSIKQEIENNPNINGYRWLLSIVKKLIQNFKNSSYPENGLK